MSLPKWSGLAISGALLCVLVGTGNGCSSSTNNGPGGDASADAARVVRHADGSAIGVGDDGSATDDGGSAPAAFDMTTGKLCNANSDCVGTAAGAPGINVCSNGIMYKYTGVTFSLYPTPVCELPPPSAAGTGNCDPCGGGACDGSMHFCDGPDDPSAPGLCQPLDFQNPKANQGICVPYCTLPSDGSAPVGCAGNNRCIPYNWVLSLAADGGPGMLTGYGICLGACEKDADCSKLGVGYVCQTDIGFCTKTTVARTKTLGTACTGGTAAMSDTSLGTCNCFSNLTSNNGYCTSSCIVGGIACPNGWVCDTGIPSFPLTFTGPMDAGITEPAFTKQNVGLVGQCVQPCTNPTDGGTPAATDSGAAADSGAASGCPMNSTCIAQTVAGPDCEP